MPSLEDLGTRQIVAGTPASDDIVAFFDVSEFGNNPVKKTTVASLLAGAETGPIVSEDITDATSNSGGVGAELGKVVLYGGGGSLNALGDVAIFDPTTPAGGFAAILRQPGSLTSDRVYTTPDAAGHLGVLRPFADSAAAGAVVSVGDVWWDTTLNKARVRLT